MLEIRGHFDGTQILLDEPCELEPNTKVIVKILPNDENADWLALGKKSFAKAYSRMTNRNIHWNKLKL